MTEEQFVEKFIAASMNRNAGSVQTVRDEGFSNFGRDRTNDMIGNCLEAIQLADPQIAEWVLAVIE